MIFKNDILESNIELLFPTPVMFDKINRKFTSKELNYVKYHSDKTYQNMGNTTSLNNYILNEPEFLI